VGITDEENKIFNTEIYGKMRERFEVGDGWKLR